MTFAQHGTGVSNGIAIGPVHILYRGEVEISECALPEQFIPDEQIRYTAAVLLARQQLGEIKQQIPAQTQADIAEFIDTHLLMLDDSTLTRVPLEIIAARRCNAEWALKLQRDALVKVFDEMEDPYLRTRRDDVDHVVNNIQRILLSSPVHHGAQPAQEHPLSGHIVVADDLSPADAVLMQHQGIAAFITETGGPTSHTAILARSMGIPAVVGLHRARELLIEDETVILNGHSGWILANPDQYSLQYYHQCRKRDHAQYLESIKNRDLPAVTNDGITINLYANIELATDITAVHETGAQGVGLYRTEYLFMNRHTPPDEEEQFEVYRQTVTQLSGKPLTLRTLDLGADKQLDDERRPSQAVNTNPALGLRAIRLCLQEPQLFYPQLRAALRASAYGPVRILLPMLSNMNELKLVMHMIQEAQAQLRSQGYAYDPHIAIGGMIEVPAAALNASMFLQHLDFLSIGTNDLIQYTLAIDRVDEEVNYLYDPLNLAVLKLIAITIDAGKALNKPVGMCGEMAGNPNYTRLLLGMGLTEFSMHATYLPVVKRVVNNSNIASLSKSVTTLLQSQNHDQFCHLLEEFQTTD